MNDSTINSTLKLSVLTNSLNLNVSDDVDDFYRKFSFDIRLTLSVVIACVIVWDVFAAMIIRRTRRTPENMRFLSSALVLLDAMIMFCRIGRNMFEADDIQEAWKFAGTTFLLSYNVTIAMMSIERNLVFFSYRLYLNYCQPDVVRKYAGRVWICCVLLYPVVRYSCKAFQKTEEKCNTLMKTAFASVLPIVILFSFACYINMAIVVRRKATGADQRVWGNRNTNLSFAYLLTTTANLILVCIDLIAKPDKRWTHLMYDLAMFCNGLSDPILYIFWFRETRLVLLQLFCRFKMKTKIEKMRMEIFDIVTTTASRNQVVMEPQNVQTCLQNGVL